MTDEKKDPTETFSLRIPTDLKKRLERMAESQNRSLNQQIVKILHMSVIAGEPQTDIYKGPSGRLLQVQAEAINDALHDATLFFLRIIDLRTDNEIKTINFGLGRTLLRDLRVKDADRSDAVVEVGLALLRYYAEQGIEPEQLSWTQYTSLGYTNMRVIHSKEVPVEIATLEEFLRALNQGDWTDYFLVGNYLNDLNKAVLEASSISLAHDLAEQIIAFTTEAHHVIGDGPWWQPFETQLLTLLILITARKRTVGRSQLRYMRSLVNSPKPVVFKQLSPEDLAAVSTLADLEDGKKAMVFARVNQRLLKLAPQSIIPLPLPIE